MKTNQKRLSIAVAIIIGVSIVSVIIMSRGTEGGEPSDESLPTHFGGPEVPSGFRSADIVSDSGFLDKKTLLSTTRPPVNDFLLSPGGTGYITIQYGFTDTGDQSIRDTLNIHIDYFNSDRKIPRVSSGNIVSSENRGIQMSISQSDIKYLDNNIVEITYMIDTESGVEPGTYILETYSAPTRFGQLITVGDKHYEGPYPWDS